MLNPGDTLLIAKERMLVEATSPRLKLRSLSCPGILRYPTLAFVEREGQTESAPAEADPASPPYYALTREELDAALRETCWLAREYWMVGRIDSGRVPEVAAAEMLGRLEGERSHG